MVWAGFFYALRDGQSGMIYFSKWGPWEKIPSGSSVRHGDTLGAYIVPVDQEKAEKIIAEIESIGSDKFSISRPIFPARHVWERLKKAQTPAAIRNTVR